MMITFISQGHKGKKAGKGSLPAGMKIIPI
jgi:hypothetical protein